MASINQLVSEFAHSLGQPNNYALRENIRSLIAHTRAEVIRRSYENHNYVDKVLTQRYKVSLVDVTDGEIPSEYVTEVVDVPGREETRTIIDIPENSIDTKGANIECNVNLYHSTIKEPIVNVPRDMYNALNAALPDDKKYLLTRMYTKEYENKVSNINSDYLIIGIDAPFTDNPTSGNYGNHFIVIPPVSETCTMVLSFYCVEGRNHWLFNDVTNGSIHQVNGTSGWVTTDKFVEYTFTNTVNSGYKIFTWTGSDTIDLSVRLSTANKFDGRIIYNAEVSHEETIVIPPSTREVYATIDGIPRIKKTAQKLPKPIRLTNNLPFDRVSSVGYLTNREYPYIKETTARFRANLPGMVGMPCYDYINGYIYMFPAPGRSFDAKKIIIEGAFEDPTAIQIANGEVDALDNELYYNNEYVLSEDMIGQIKDIIYKRDLLNTVRQTNEIPNEIKYN